MIAPITVDEINALLAKAGSKRRVDIGETAKASIVNEVLAGLGSEVRVSPGDDCWVGIIAMRQAEVAFNLRSKTDGMEP